MTLQTQLKFMSVLPSKIIEIDNLNRELESLKDKIIFSMRTLMNNSKVTQSDVTAFRDFLIELRYDTRYNTPPSDHDYILFILHKIKGNSPKVVYNTEQLYINKEDIVYQLNNKADYIIDIILKYEEE